jgi:hypothetical protein
MAAVACGTDEEGSTAPAVAGGSCPAERCIAVQTVLDTLGRPFLEPTSLPDDYELYSRSLAADGTAPGTDPAKATYTLFSQYRFRSSPNVPAIIVSQSWPFTGNSAEIKPQDSTCGELEASAIGPIYYVEGLVRVLPVPEENLWLVCKDETEGHDETHYIVAATNGGLIEIIAFPEAGVTKEDMMLFVNSLEAVSGTND